MSEVEMFAGCLKEDGNDTMLVMEKRPFGSGSILAVYCDNRDSIKFMVMNCGSQKIGGGLTRVGLPRWGICLACFLVASIVLAGSDFRVLIDG